MNETIPWYRSAVIQRIALSIVVQALAATHLSKYVSSADIAPLVDQLLELGGLALAGWAAHARATKPTPPIAMTQAKADTANLPITQGTPNESTPPVSVTPVPAGDSKPNP